MLKQEQKTPYAVKRNRVLGASFTLYGDVFIALPVNGGRPEVATAWGFATSARRAIPCGRAHRGFHQLPGSLSAVFACTRPRQSC